ncbi:hypothetical protein WR25_20148 [Diploscapter pachys]|uniref:ABC transmembrane type-1 domain-containing protein n=1 Tax=Diploscapter pachys TaxID=2018661 RepID=A0A2A2L0F0_9BILA|nr:hypothetical protein WR25_20148 [Diploscapter pachys]
MGALLGNVGQTFIDIAKALKNETITPEEREEAMNYFISEMIFNCSVYFAIGMWSVVTNWAYRTSIYYFSECMITRFRTSFIAHLLELDAAEFDKAATGQFNVLLNYHIDRVRDGFNDRLGYAIVVLMESCLGLLIAFLTDWKLALISCLITPILLILSIVVVVFENRNHEKKSEMYEKAGEICSQAIGNIRTVIACNGQQRELTEYTDLLKQTRSHALVYRTWNRVIDVATVFTV